MSNNDWADTSITPKSESYRRHYLFCDFTRTRWFVEVEGVVIATCNSIEEARAAVDGLLD